MVFMCIYKAMKLDRHSVYPSHNPNPWFQCNLLLMPNRAFPVQPTANAEVGLPSATSANAEVSLPNATYC